ncbi:hypothetical protein GQ43DRAFT_379920, partial [Delitschia confertaspora ATCC 74209]
MADYTTRTALILTLYILGFLEYGNAHSWIEQAYVTIDGTIIGQPGFPRGNVLRTSSSFTDMAMTYLLPPNGRTPSIVLPSDPICKETQRTWNQTIGSPSLVAHANDTILLLYQENGHVTKLNEDPRHNASGLIYVYGTSESTPTDTLKSIHKEWTYNEYIQSEGSHGLMALTGFDDKHCYQNNDSPLTWSRKK